MIAGIFGFLANGLRSVDAYGFGQALKLGAFELYYELRLRSGTARLVEGEALGVSDWVLAHGTPHLPTPYYLIHRAFKYLASYLDGTVLVDFGCGLGRALIFASQFPFRKIVGVEASPALSAAARRNLLRHYARRRKAAPAWCVICCDAALFEVPEDATVFYFADPFDETVLEPVVRNILASTSKNPRQLTAVYVNPTHPDVFLRFGFRTITSEVNARGRGFMIFTTDGEPLASSARIDGMAKQEDIRVAEPVIGEEEIDW